MSVSQDKIRSLSGKMSFVLKLGLIAAGIIGVLASAAIGILLFAGEETKASFLAAFHVTANNGTVIGIEAGALMVLFAIMLVDTVLAALAIYLVHAVFAEIRRGCTPFSGRNIVRIKKVAAVAAVLSIVGSCSDGLVDYYTIGAPAWRVNVTGLIIAAVIYCISLIFDYGCELQRESDETL